MDRNHWRKDKPTRRQVKSVMDFHSDMSNLIHEYEKEEDSMFESAIFKKAVCVLNDLFELQRKIEGRESCMGDPSSLDMIESVHLSARYDEHLKFDFLVKYHFEDDDVQTEDWYVGNKIYVFSVLKKWISGVYWAYEISDLEHITDFEMGHYWISFSITVKQ